MENTNYIFIQPWMINLFKPKDGKKGSGVDYIKVLIFAYIFSYSRDGKSKWYGKQQKLAELVGCTEQVVCNKLKELVKDGYIDREEIQAYGMFHHNNYMVNSKYIAINSEITSINSEIIAVNPELTNNKSNNNSIKNSIYIDNSEVKNEAKDVKKKKEFIPPTLIDVKNYIEEKGYSVNPEYFYEFYSANNWKDSYDNPIKSWKMKLVTWNNREQKKAKPRKVTNIPSVSITEEYASSHNEL